MSSKTTGAAGNPVDADELHLPEQLYYDHVRPFTPHGDRPALNKRTGSTRFYVGERATLDATYLTRFGERGKYHGGNAVREGDGPPPTFEGLPYAVGEPGTASFRVVFPSTESEDCMPPTKDPGVALEALADCRRSWDSHLSKIESPSARLHACLVEFWKFAADTKVVFKVDCQLLFPKESLQSVISLHYDLDPRSVNGPPSDLARCPLPGMGIGCEAFPNNLLGYVLGVLVATVVTHTAGDSNGESDNITHDLYQVTMSMIAALVAVADVTSLFEPLHAYPEKAINRGNGIYSTGVVSALSSFPGYELIWEPGESIFRCMKRFYGINVHYHDLTRFKMLLAYLEMERPVQKLRFEVGDEVECFTEDHDWKRGKVRKLWVRDDCDQHSHPHMKYPYEVLLHDGATAYAADDIDQVIRVPREQLRFARGDRVLARTAGGWEEGTIFSLWQKVQTREATWFPYVVEINGGKLIAAPEDSDAYVRAA